MWLILPFSRKLSQSTCLLKEYALIVRKIYNIILYNREYYMAEIAIVWLQ